MKPRNTQQKQEILNLISGEGMHCTAETVHKELLKTNPNIGLATVYRNLNRFAQEGLITRFELNGSTVYDGNSLQHDHIHCVKCGKVCDVFDCHDEIDDQKVTSKTGFDVIAHTTLYQGICEACKNNN